MTIPRQYVAGARVETNGLIAGVVVALLTATALFIGDATGWNSSPEFKAAALVVTVGVTRVIAAKILIERQLLKELQENQENQNTAKEFYGAMSRAISVGLVTSGAAVYFMLTREMGWDVLNTSWGISIACGITASTTTKWIMVCDPAFMVIRGNLQLPELGNPRGNK